MYFSFSVSRSARPSMNFLIQLMQYFLLSPFRLTMAQPPLGNSATVIFGVTPEHLNRPTEKARYKAIVSTKFSRQHHCTNEMAFCILKWLWSASSNHNCFFLISVGLQDRKNSILKRNLLKAVIFADQFAVLCTNPQGCSRNNPCNSDVCRCFK